MADTHLHVLMDDGHIVIIERLIGSENYAQWLTQFDAVAEQKGYAALFSGKEKLGFKPQIKTYVDAFKHRSTGSSVQVLGQGTILDQSLANAEYELDCEEHEAREQRARKAIILLYGSIDYNLRSMVRGFDDPKVAMEFVKKRFEPVPVKEVDSEEIDSMKENLLVKVTSI